MENEKSKTPKLNSQGQAIMSARCLGYCFDATKTLPMNVILTDIQKMVDAYGEYAFVSKEYEKDNVVKSYKEFCSEHVPTKAEEKDAVKIAKAYYKYLLGQKSKIIATRKNMTDWAKFYDKYRDLLTYDRCDKVGTAVGTAVGYASNVAPVIGAAWVSKKIVKSIKKHQDKKKARKEKLAKECVELKGEILKNPIYIRESADELFALIDYIYS